jgi:hypothetical protein
MCLDSEDMHDKKLDTDICHTGERGNLTEKPFRGIQVTTELKTHSVVLKQKNTRREEKKKLFGKTIPSLMLSFTIE